MCGSSARSCRTSSAAAFFDADTIDSFRDATTADAVACVILIAAAALGVIVVRQVSEAMERTHAVPAVPA